MLPRGIDRRAAIALSLAAALPCRASADPQNEKEKAAAIAVAAANAETRARLDACGTQFPGHRDRFSLSRLVWDGQNLSMTMVADRVLRTLSDAERRELEEKLGAARTVEPRLARLPEQERMD